MVVPPSMSSLTSSITNTLCLLDNNLAGSRLLLNRCLMAINSVQWDNLILEWLAMVTIASKVPQWHHQLMDLLVNNTLVIPQITGLLCPLFLTSLRINKQEICIHLGAKFVSYFDESHMASFSLYHFPTIQSVD